MVVPGAVLVQGGTSSNTLRTSNTTELDSNSRVDAPSLVVAALVVNNHEDEEDAKLGASDDILERKVQEEVQSRLLRNQNNAVVAERIGDDGMPKSSTNAEQSDRKLFGLNRKTSCYLMVAFLILAIGVIAGVVMKNEEVHQHQHQQARSKKS